ncbi:hypothetical protein RhiirA4_468964 [Rhizophagus irregularis]|uniref:Uncharacterized protein n=1 Tax=Rhizophagus irregularis TaxID=588596 RepID=A0A2I1GYN6_9GLOM|nr:hypothetical protein RhiirA4_468964 [Rhizophagus irregularis]
MIKLLFKQKYEYIFGKKIRIKGVKYLYGYFKDEDKLAEVVAKTLVKEGYEQKNGQSSEQVRNNKQEVSKSNSSMSDEEEVVDTVNKYRQDILNEEILKCNTGESCGGVKYEKRTNDQNKVEKKLTVNKVQEYKNLNASFSNRLQKIIMK